MTEPEVSIYIALYYIKNEYTEEDVIVSIDGAHVKTGSTVHFDLKSFLNQCGCEKCDYEMDRWQGKYRVLGYGPKLIITSESGIGDVNIRLLNGMKLYIESKKGKNSKAGQEYPLMREAIGQLMTGGELTADMIPVVAVPYTEKSRSLAERWLNYSQMKAMKIQFFLVQENGEIHFVN